MMKNRILNLFLLITIMFLFSIFTGCGRADRRQGDAGFPDGNDEGPSSFPRLTDREVELRLTNTFLNLDSAATLAELYETVSSRLEIEIVVEAKSISPDMPIDLKHSAESFVIQVLELVSRGTGTRLEISRGKLWVKDAY